MTLLEWLDAHGRGAVTALSHKSGVSMLTIGRVRDGMALNLKSVAQKLSDATGGEVSVNELLGLSEPESADSVHPGAP